MNNQLEKKNQDTMKKVFKLIRPYMHYLILSLIFGKAELLLSCELIVGRLCSQVPVCTFSSFWVKRKRE